MKILTLKINEQNYMSGKISTFHTKEAMKIQRQALALGEQAQGLKEEINLEGAAEIFDALLELSDKKTWLLCEVYGNKFTPDELEKALSSEEIDVAVNEIIGVVSAAIEKN